MSTNSDADSSASEAVSLQPDQHPSTVQIPTWVLYSGCSAGAFRLYALLVHALAGRPAETCPVEVPQKDLIRALLSNRRQMVKYRAELVALEAVRWEEYRHSGGMRRQYRYWVMLQPPASPVPAQRLGGTSPDWVYVIRDTNSGRVKIGISAAPEKRLAALQTGFSGTLHLEWQTLGGRALESYLHDHFGRRRIRGEWFDFGKADAVALISQAAADFGRNA